MYNCFVTNMLFSFSKSIFVLWDLLHVSHSIIWQYHKQVQSILGHLLEDLHATLDSQLLLFHGFLPLEGDLATMPYISNIYIYIYMGGRAFAPRGFRQGRKLMRKYGRMCNDAIPHMGLSYTNLMQIRC